MVASPRSARRSRDCSTPVEGLFFPQTKSLGLDQRSYSPVLQKIVFAGATGSTSFREASQTLGALSDLEVPYQQIRRVTEAIGAERLAERAQVVTEFLTLPLMQRESAPHDQIPQVVAVSMDGGRYQRVDTFAKAAAPQCTTEDRSAKPLPSDTSVTVDIIAEPSASAPAALMPFVTLSAEPAPAERAPLATLETLPTPPPTAVETLAASAPTAAETASTAACEANASDNAKVDKSQKKNHWYEFKAGCMLTLASQTFAEDPAPEVPKAFLDGPRVATLAQQSHSQRKPDRAETFQRHSSEDDPAAAPMVTTTSARPGAPQVLVRSVVASKNSHHAFGASLASAAWLRGCFAAPRRAFLSDGASGNWTVWKEHFARFVPILDFIHLRSRVFAAAMAGCSQSEGWQLYVQWITWLWQGKVEPVIDSLPAKSARLGPPAEDDPETAPRKVVAENLHYLITNRERMHYDEYRRLGLPLTTCHMESTVKQINRRVKGSEMFWESEEGEAILQLRAGGDLRTSGPSVTMRREPYAGGSTRHNGPCRRTRAKRFWRILFFRLHLLSPVVLRDEMGTSLVFRLRAWPTGTTERELNGGENGTGPILTRWAVYGIVRPRLVLQAWRRVQSAGRPRIVKCVIPLPDR